MYQLISWAALITLLVLGWPSMLGGSTDYTVVSGHSMDPTYRTGDMLVVKKPEVYKKGQIVVYQVPQGEPGEGLFVVHRIVGGDNVKGWTTQGETTPVKTSGTPTTATW